MSKPCGAGPEPLAVLDRLETADAASDLDDHAQSLVKQLGFDGYYYIRYDIGLGFTHVDHRPAEWLSYYHREGLIHADPVTVRVCSSKEPFRWEEAFAAQRIDAGWMRRYLKSRDFGLNEGYNVQLHGRGLDRATFCVYAEDARRFNDALRANRGWVKALAHCYHNIFERFLERADPEVRLSPRELECLHWASQGKTNADIAGILSISANTVNAHLNAAAGKLGTTTRIQTVVKAIRLHLILP